MDFTTLSNVLDNIPHMNLTQAKRITNFIKKYNLESILELGFRHGVSTCYMAAQLKEIGAGKITTIDLISARNAEPNIEELLEKLDLENYVQIYYEPTSYIWRLMKLIEENPKPIFDFCYIDGAHNWFVDGFAFFLVDKLLKENGWIIFDDLYWTYHTSPSLKNTEMVKNMPEEERTSAQVKKVYDLLVKTHPNYSNFKTKYGWGYAQKLHNNSDIITHIKSKSLLNMIANYFNFN